MEQSDSERFPALIPTRGVRDSGANPCLDRKSFALSSPVASASRVCGRDVRP